jgi:hypothetical protein
MSPMALSLTVAATRGVGLSLRVGLLFLENGLLANLLMRALIVQLLVGLLFELLYRLLML